MTTGISITEHEHLHVHSKLSTQLKTPACRTSRESMGEKSPPNNTDLDPPWL